MVKRMAQGALRTAMTMALLGLPCLGASADPATPVYLDLNRSFQDRAADLVSHMTLEEKVAQMQNAAPAIPRLGIPAYDWWNEALHGVARAGAATVFPQAIGMAATFDTDLMTQVATAISDEARAKHQEFLRRDMHGRYQGLTFWSPNINIFRDPRWGRGQETYGEDPYLTSRMGVTFVRGLQGDDPTYRKLDATAKHFAVHSGPESERHHFDVHPSERDLYETYLPAFQALVQEGKVDAVMGAYNRVNGESASASQRLLQDILRKAWGFQGYVMSDCDAVDDIFVRHQIVQTAEQASALAVKTGDDLNCGHTYAALARRAADESIVLLKNDGVLPLSTDIHRIAVIGPTADDVTALLGNYHGTPSVPVTILQGIRKAVPRAEVVYAKGASLVEGFDDQSGFPLIDAAYLRPSADSSEHGLKGEYFRGTDFTATPVLSRVDGAVNFRWDHSAPTDDLVAQGELPAAQALDPTHFSVRWSGQLVPPKSGRYELSAAAAQGYRLYLDGKLVLDAWDADSATHALSAPVELVAGKAYDVRLEYAKADHNADVRLAWRVPGAKPPFEEAMSAARHADAIVFVGGLNSDIEGEEMKVNYPGFAGGDRTDLRLPATQEKLLKALRKTGKPVVLVLTSGSALAVDWAQQHLPGIVLAWYPGQRGGDAVADVLFGNTNPSGRLPVTFYKADEKLPAFDDYRMDGRTYRYFKGTPLYPFGYGLSYTSFAYSDIHLDQDTIGTDGHLKVTLKVKNTGKRAGEEVVQLYVRATHGGPWRSNKELRGFQHVSLQPGEEKSVAFELSPRMDLRYYDDTRGAYAVDPGSYEVQVGASSVDVRLRAPFDVRD